MAFDSDDAKLGAGVIGVVAILWRLVFHGRRDIRTDKADAQIQDGYKALIDEQKATIAEQKQTITDQIGFLRKVGKSFDEETAKRRAAEQKVHDLEMRVAHLELVVRQLGGVV